MNIKSILGVLLYLVGRLSVCLGLLFLGPVSVLAGETDPVLPQSRELASGLSGPGETEALWNGIYGGLLGAYAWTEAMPRTMRIPESSYSLSNASLGGFFGINHRFENDVVIGMEGEVGYDWGEKRRALDVRIGGGHRTATGRLSLGWNAAFRVRAGYAFEKALIYGAVGGQVSEARLAGYMQQRNFDTHDKVLGGWHVAAGLDYAVTRKLFARLEYRYADFPTVSHAFRWDRDFQVSATRNTVLLGLGYAF